jgi:4-amino-4-deoxy-L-arabinose transferase-like glycosyltransferase
MWRSMHWTPPMLATFPRMAGIRLLLASILALGAWTRFSGLDLGWFLQDQVRDATIALEIVSGRDFPLVGPEAGATFHLGPLFYYLLAIPYGLSINPLVGLVFQTLLNLISIYLAYRLGKEMFGPAVGLVGAALYAVFPSAVLSGRPLWNPGFIPVCTTLFLVMLWHFLVRSRPWRLVPLLLLLGALLQIHASTIIFVLLLPAALLLYRPTLSLGALLSGLLCLVLLYTPLLMIEVQHGFPDVYNLLLWVQKPPSSHNLQPFWVTAWRGLWVPFLLPQRLATALPNWTLPGLFAVIQWVELVVLGLGVLTLGVRLVKSADRRPYLLLAFWFILPFIIIPHLKVSIPWYYFDVLYPAQFLVIGLLAQLWLDVWPATRSRWRPQYWLRFAIYTLIGAFVVAQVWFTMSFDRAVRQAGVLRGDPADATLNLPPGSGGVIVESIPLRFELALAELFLREFGVGHAALEKVAHGAVFQQFREDKGFSFLIVSPGKVPGHLDPSLHYVLLRSKAKVVLGRGRQVRSGPYRILAYHPSIRYDSWKWSTNPGPEWQGEAFDDSTWRPLHLPVRQVPNRAAHEPIPYSPWPGKTVAFRGWLEVPSAEQRFWLILNIRDFWAPHTVQALYLNGQPLKLVRTHSYDTFTSRNIEVIVDVTSDLRLGSNLVAFQITGPNELFDLDVYELPLASDGAG